MNVRDDLTINNHERTSYQVTQCKHGLNARDELAINYCAQTSYQFTQCKHGLNRRDHPASRASFNFPAAENWEEKEALHKSCQFFEVAADSKFGLVSPDKSGFGSGHIFLEKPTVKAEPTVRKQNGGEGSGEGFFAE